MRTITLSSASRIKRLVEKKEQGFGLLEVTISILILGIIGVAFFSGMNTILTASFTTDRQAVALSLAQSQMEYIKQQPYNNDNGANMGKYLSINSIDIPDGYTIYGWDNSTGASATFAKFWDPNANDFTTSNTTYIQKILVVIEHNSENVTGLEGYKVDR